MYDLRITVAAHDPLNHGFGYIVTIRQNDEPPVSFPDFKTHAGALNFASDMFAEHAARTSK